MNRILIFHPSIGKSYPSLSLRYHCNPTLQILFLLNLISLEFWFISLLTPFHLHFIYIECEKSRNNLAKSILTESKIDDKHKFDISVSCGFFFLLSFQIFAFFILLSYLHVRYILVIFRTILFRVSSVDNVIASNVFFLYVL